MDICGGHGLSLGCGGGSLEAELIGKNICASVEGCDISPYLVELAGASAAAKGLPVKYYVADLNNCDLGKARFDVIVGAGIFHHVQELEGLFQRLSLALKPGGALLIYDYVGPKRFQWTREQMERCNKWAGMIPMRYRVKKGYPWYYYMTKGAFNLVPFIYAGIVENALRRLLPERAFFQFLRLKAASVILTEVSPIPPEHLLATDPSEAVRSDEIVPALKEFFEIKKLLPLGGTLAQPIFGRIASNFARDAKGCELAATILADERECIRQGLLPSDFIAVLATAKGRPAVTG